MKLLLIPAVCLIALINLINAQTDTLVINPKNSQVEKIAISDIRKITFENISAVPVQSEANQGLTIYENFPNPFTERTSIEFEIASPGNVEIIIYDNSGKHIQALQCGNCQAGKNTLQWNSLDKNNSRVQSGVYYYEVHFGKEVQSKKMLVIN